MLKSQLFPTPPGQQKIFPSSIAWKLFTNMLEINNQVTQMHPCIWLHLCNLPPLQCLEKLLWGTFWLRGQGTHALWPWTPARVCCMPHRGVSFNFHFICSRSPVSSLPNTHFRSPLNQPLNAFSHWLFSQSISSYPPQPPDPWTELAAVWILLPSQNSD